MARLHRELRIMLDDLGRLAFDAAELDAEIARRYEEWAANSKYQPS